MALATFLYNTMLVLFIALHLAVGGGFMFAAGVYAGVYVCQNYDIPRVDEPQELWKKVTEFMESRRKTPPSEK